MHPQFKQICNYIIDLGFSLEIITSGKISKIPYEIDNLEYAIELYERGKLYIELSYHYGRNQDAYKAIRNKLIDLYGIAAQPEKNLAPTHKTGMTILVR